MHNGTSLTALNAGMTLREQGTASTIAADIAPHRLAGKFLRAVIQEYADAGIEFTAEDVRDALRHNDTVVRELDARPNLLPAIMSNAARTGLIVSVGMCRPSRPSRHASRNLVWKGTRRP